MLFGHKTKMTVAEKQTCESMCANYALLQNYIMELSEAEIVQCIVAEKKGRGRSNIMTRLYARFSELRKSRERKEMFS